MGEQHFLFSVLFLSVDKKGQTANNNLTTLSDIATVLRLSQFLANTTRCVLHTYKFKSTTLCSRECTDFLTTPPQISQ